MDQSGIYIIQSKLKPERVYVGSALDFNRRWWHHRTSLRKGNHHSHKLQRHYNKYGESDLVFEVIESGSYLCKQHLLSREQGWMYHFKYSTKTSPFFNECELAGNILGRKDSDITRKKKGVHMIGNTYGHKTKGKKRPPFPESWHIKQRNRKHIWTDDARRKNSISMLGNKNGIGNRGHAGILSWNHGMSGYETKRIKLIVVQIDFNGCQIKEWISAKEVAIYMGVKTGTITCACNGNSKCRVVKGFLWKYKKDLYV